MKVFAFFFFSSSVRWSVNTDTEFCSISPPFLGFVHIVEICILRGSKIFCLLPWHGDLILVCKPIEKAQNFLVPFSCVGLFLQTFGFVFVIVKGDGYKLCLFLVTGGRGFWMLTFSQVQRNFDMFVSWGAESVWLPILSLCVQPIYFGF